VPSDRRLRLVARVVATVSVAGLSLFAVHLLRRPAEATFHRLEAHSPTPDSALYAAREWHPAITALSAVTEMGGHPTRKDRVELYSRSAFVFDLDSGEVLLERAPDNRQPVASLTKLVTSLAMASAVPDLDRRICVDHQLYPSRNGARSHLSTGDCYTGWDLLGATLVASDNRAAFGLQVVSGLSYDDFVARMGEVASEIGMSQSDWADPAGLEDDNLSTARDMARAAVAVATHPTLAYAATAATWSLEELTGGRFRTLFSTDHMAGRSDLEILAAKTGYTGTAGYCFAGVFRAVSGRTLVISVLGSPRKGGRWRDVEHILDVFG
jgi:serine-type D-Ala-D-Ala endopeptidase (penicillin-binding protein 7)